MTTTPLEVRIAELEAHHANSIPQAYLDVLRDLASGLDLKQIARKRGISHPAATMRLARARHRLNATNTAQAVYEATMRGLLRGVPRP